MERWQSQQSTESLDRIDRDDRGEWSGGELYKVVSSRSVVKGCIQVSIVWDIRTGNVQGDKNGA